MRRDVSPALAVAFVAWFGVVTLLSTAYGLGAVSQPAWEPVFVPGGGLVVAWAVARAVGR